MGNFRPILFPRITFYTIFLMPSLYQNVYPNVALIYQNKINKELIIFIWAISIYMQSTFVQICSWVNFLCVMKSNLAFLHIFGSSSLRSSALLLKLSFGGTIYWLCESLVGSLCGIPDILTMRMFVYMFFATSVIDSAIILGYLSEFNSLVPPWIITWSGLFSLI